MKKTIVLFTVFLTVLGCGSGTEKPDNLISEDKMVDIIYDLSLLEGIRSTDYNSFKQRGINPSKYIYRKYNIDSLQFVKSDRYYASDIEVYAKMYEEVAERIEAQKRQFDSLAKIIPKTQKKSLSNSEKDSALKKTKKELLDKLNSDSGNTRK